MGWTLVRVGWSELKMSGSGLKMNGSGWEWIRVSGSKLECVGVDGSRWEWIYLFICTLFIVDNH